MHGTGAGCYELTVPETLMRAEIFAAVQAAGGAVHELVERRRSLEEVFLHAVGPGERED